MNFGQRIAFVVVTLLVLVQVSACTKQISWTEEVLLNTGDRLVVRRQLSYVREGAPGNPFEMGWSPRRGGDMSFEWKGRQYAFNEHNAPLLVAISPRGKPVVVANAAIERWDERNSYGCKTPHYVQFEPDESGKQWTWPSAIEPWLIGLPANLLQRVPDPSDSKRQYSAADVRAIAEAATYGSEGRHVDPLYVPLECKRMKR